MRNWYPQIVIIVALALLVPASANGQDEISIRRVIDTFFEALNKGDSSLMNSTLAKQVTLATITRNREGSPVLLQGETKTELLAAITKPRSETYSEPIWNVVIQMDGDFAQVWCDYAFYIGKTFSHCGVDALQLFKDPDGWKIFHIADTRRREGCNVPEDVRRMYEN